MNERDDLGLSPDAARARDELRRLPAPRADAAFRERLKRKFTSGAFERPRLRVLPGLRRWRPVVAWVLPAAAALLVVALITARTPGWSVAGSSGQGFVTVDSQPVPIGHADELERRIHAGSRLEVPAGCELTLAWRSVMVMQVTSETRVTVPSAPRFRFSGATARAEIERGEVFIATGRGFRGLRLAIAAPLASVEVTGTSLAVIAQPDGNCVCVLDGRVRVAPRGAAAGGAVMVEAGNRRFIYADGRPPETLRILDHSEHELRRLRAERAGLLDGGR